jgi:pimeloyl-ACP methyl ester carboxylesterase
MTPAPALMMALSLATPFVTQSSDLGAPPGRLVDIGGHKVHVLCSGEGAPTVVLEAGASAFAIDWSLVQPEIARRNRVCSYDRLGYGWSETGSPETPARVVANLHATLVAIGERGPFVLVGASMGGIYARMYRLQYPDEVAAMVLVDPSHEDDLFTMFQGKGVTIGSLTAEEIRSTIPAGPAKLPRRFAQTGPPFDRLPPDLYRRRVALETQLIDSMPESVPHEIVLEVVEGQRAAFSTLQKLGASQEHPRDDGPLIVLTRGVRLSPEFRELHARLARSSTNSRHTVVEGAGHEIHLFEPTVVILAIQDVIGALTNKTRLPLR